MAKFNPDVPDSNDPNYLGLSRGISQPEGDKSGLFLGQASAAGAQAIGALAEGAGKVFTQAVTGVDNYIKDKIDQGLYKSVDEERGGYIDSLKTLTNQFKTGKLASSEGDPMDAYAQATPPDGIEDIDNTVGNLNTAYSAGKFSHTYYIQQLDNTAKEMRDRYPGYRDYIDRKISAITGINPANRYVDALLRDLNQSATAGSKENTQVMNFLKSNLKYSEKDSDSPIALGMIARMQAGEKVGMAEAVARLGPYIAREHTMAVRKQQLEIDKAQGINTEESVMKEVSGMISTKLKVMMDTFRTQKGEAVGDKGYSLNDLRKWVNNVETGNIVPTQQQIVENTYGAQYLARSMKEELWNKAVEGGYTSVSKEAPERIKKMIDDHVTIPVNYVVDAINKGRPDLAAAAAAKIQARFDDTHNDILANDHIFRAISLLKFVEKHAAGSDWMKSFVQDETQYAGPVQEAFKANRNYIITQEDLRKTGIPTTFTDAGKAAQVYSNKSNTFLKENYKSINNLTDAIIDPKNSPELKQNIILGAFSPGNRDWLDNFNKASKYLTFDQMTRPKIIDEAYKQGLVKPEVWKITQDWTLNSYFNKLYSEEMATFKNMQSDPRVTFTFDPESKHLGMVVKSGVTIGVSPGEGGARKPSIPPEKFMQVGEKKDIINVLDKLNKGMDNVLEVVKRNPNIDINAFMIEHLKGKGVNPDNVFGMAKDIEKAIITGVTAGDKPSQNASQSPTNDRTSDKNDQGLSGIPHYTKNAKSAAQGAFEAALADVMSANKSRSEVKSSKKWWGDKEAEAAGLYDKKK